MDRQLWQVDERNVLVQKADQASHEPTFRLSFFSEKQHVMPSKQSDIDLGDDRIVVADNAWKKRGSSPFNCCTKFDRISCLTERDFQPLSLSSAKFVGKGGKRGISLEIEASMPIRRGVVRPRLYRHFKGDGGKLPSDALFPRSNSSVSLCRVCNSCYLRAPGARSVGSDLTGFTSFKGVPVPYCV